MPAETEIYLQGGILHKPKQQIINQLSYRLDRLGSPPCSYINSVN